MARTCRRTRFRCSRPPTRSSCVWPRPPAWCATCGPTASACAQRPGAAFPPPPTSPTGWCASPACRSARRTTPPDGSSSAPRKWVAPSPSCRWPSCRGRAGDHRRGLRRARPGALGCQPGQLWRHRPGAGPRRSCRRAQAVSRMILRRCQPSALGRADPSRPRPLLGPGAAIGRLRQKGAADPAAGRVRHLSAVLPA